MSQFVSFHEIRIFIIDYNKHFEEKPMANPEQTSLFKRSILWLCVLLAVVGLTYYYEENLFRDGWEALTASTATKELSLIHI